MADRNVETSLRLAVASMTLVAMGLQDFVTQILRHGRSGEPLDDAAVDVLRATSIRNLKNASASGLPIDEEAEVFAQAIGNLEALMDLAIRNAKAAPSE